MATEYPYEILQALVTYVYAEKVYAPGSRVVSRKDKPLCRDLHVHVYDTSLETA